MKRGAPLVRKPFRRQRAEGPTAPREVKPWAAALASATLRPAPGTYAGSTIGQAVEKSKPYRDHALLDMARGRPCLLLVPGICSHRVDTVVAAHSNLSIHGKGGTRKADDCYTVWACLSCHSWLDQGMAPADVKQLAFTLGHINQVQAWRIVAAAPDEPERFRRAARRALERLSAMPAGEAP